ncbi:3-demethylubiquinone-9 3-O-methyltransferase [Teladorsagia circumcincta]|uniref:3-demethylubiquinone-9 3-O-methyltransferase n=1 Tax=Teladorsagia circumcincta TaxID=45464 RepID=A0A2G9URS9_TELCI|nr:3-demethylubiquinone-9 3-O-methyltransferase [Teladorsagia circumcincta]
MSSVDSEEVRTFTQLSSEWHNESGSFKALHSLNVLRVPWILQNVKSKGSVVDVGCGGGILSVPLARAGLKVTGIDATEDADVMKIVPQGVHQWEKFVEPETLSSVLERNGCSVRAVIGFTYNPATNVWRWTPFTSVNYALLAVKT